MSMVSHLALVEISKIDGNLNGSYANRFLSTLNRFRCENTRFVMNVIKGHPNSIYIFTLFKVNFLSTYRQKKAMFYFKTSFYL